MIAISEFKLSDDLASISLKVDSSDEITNIRIYVGENYLTSEFYDIPLVAGEITYEGVITAAQLGESTPMTDIYIVYADNRFDEKVEAGIWSLEAPSQCLANKILEVPKSCKECKGINDVNIVHMNIEATVMFLALKSFEKALKTKERVELVCTNYGDFSIPAGGACPGGIGCWIIEYDFIVQ